MDALNNLIREIGLSPHLVFYELLVFFIGLILLQIIRRSLKILKNRVESFIIRLRFFDVLISRVPFISFKKQVSYFNMEIF